MTIKNWAFSLLLAGTASFSQEKDSLTVAQQAGKQITDKFPSTRTFDLQYEQLGPVKYDNTLFGNALEKGRIDRHSRLKAAVNLKLYTAKSQRFFITNSMRFKYETFGVTTDYDPVTEIVSHYRSEEYRYWAEAVSATYFSQLFGKPVLYNASLTVDGDEKNVQRLKGLVSATIVLKKTERTTMATGIIAFIDPSSILPFAPIFTYEHRFLNSPWTLDIILPQRFLVRRDLFENGRISLGTELNSENFYLNLSGGGLNGVYELNQLELKSGFKYEYNFSQHFIGTLKTGLNNVITTKITERGRKTNKYVIENKQGPQVYISAGISYNLF